MSSCFIMAALWNRAGHYIFALWFLLLSSIYYLVLFFLAHSQLSQIGCLPYFLKWCGLSADLGCSSETCCTRVAENTGHTNRQEFAICAPLHNFVKQQYLPHMSLQYGELRPTGGWDRFISLGHPSKFQRLSHLGIVTARYSSSVRQPNFAVLNRGRHLYWAGRPSRWTCGGDIAA